MIYILSVIQIYKIVATPIRLHRRKDQIQWAFTKSGKFFIKSAYLQYDQQFHGIISGKLTPA